MESEKKNDEHLAIIREWLHNGVRPDQYEITSCQTSERLLALMEIIVFEITFLFEYGKVLRERELYQGEVVSSKCCRNFIVNALEDIMM